MVFYVFVFCVFVFYVFVLVFCVFVFVLCHGPHPSRGWGAQGRGFILLPSTQISAPTPCVVPTVPRVSPGAFCPPLLPVPPQGSPVQCPSLSPLSASSPLGFSALAFPQSHLSPGAPQPSRVCPWAGLCSQESSRSLRAVDCPSIGNSRAPGAHPGPQGPSGTLRDPQGTRRDALFQLGLCLC